ncbi:MAG: SUMF1/EgtB/PvdO family nonheme iron enzyme [Planctomycetota bacterium]|nr:SUMF1/EgtB/PvdO family nonheme iron enzyme [Planctomycetota bacterium]
MSDQDARVACPACETRFRAPIESVPEGSAGLKARCRRCGATFRVLNRDGVLNVELVEAGEVAEAAPVPAAPTTEGSLAVPSGSSSAGGLTTGVQDLPIGAFEVGDRIGRYEVESILGRGGMGTIYKSYDPAANRQVALKVLRKDTSPLDKLRFEREVQVQGNVQHPNIMPILDSGTVGDQRYYVMELLKDPLDLAYIVEQARSDEIQKDPILRPLARIEGLIERIILPLCKAVHYANVHEGVLHRDIKPTNILLDRKGLVPKLIDFGVSSMLDKKNARLAHLAREIPIPLKGDGVRVTGTLVFMPPEQARGDADRRGDVWAIGALLHYLVTGQPPLEQAVRPLVSKAERIQGLKLLIQMATEEGRLQEAGDFRKKIQEIELGTERTVADLQQDVLKGNYLPRPPGMSRELDAIIRRAMAKKPADRYRHAMELHDDLVNWLANLPVQARVKSSGAAGGMLYRGRLLVRRQWRLVAAVALLAVVGALFLFQDKEVGPDAARLSAEKLEAAQSKERLGEYDAAYALAREAITHDPGSDEAFALIDRVRQRQRLDQALKRAKALRQSAAEAFLAKDDATAERALAALDEVLRDQISPNLPDDVDPEVVAQVERLRAAAADLQPLTIEGAPALATLRVGPIDRDGRIDWLEQVQIDGSTFQLPGGSWLLQVTVRDRTVYVPFRMPRGGNGMTVKVGFDPARLDADMVYVGPGRVRGPLGEVNVKPLLWDAVEVSCARYAKFLDSLSPEERAQRVPRTVGALGSPVIPLWEKDGDRFKPPPGGATLPVEGISLYDARAFAAFEKKRLPTAGEWAWAATGPDGRVCSVGPAKDLWSGAAFVARPKEGPGVIRGSSADRSPFGLFDMAGNVAELTSSLATVEGRSGWVVMGGGYLTDPGRAIVTNAITVPGWLPLEGVGFRCVKPTP